MSGLHGYHSDRWARAGGDRDAGPRASEQEYPHSSTILRPDDRRFPPHLDHHRARTEGHQGGAHSSTLGPMRERASRAFRIVQDTPSSQRDHREELGYPEDMLAGGPRLLSSDSIHGSSSLDRGDRHLLRTPSGFELAYSSSQNISNYQKMQTPWDDPGRAWGPGYQERNPPPQTSTTIYPWDTGYQFSQDRLDLGEKAPPKRSTITIAGSTGDERRSKRYRGGRDEFDGSVQYLSKPPRNVPEPREGDLPPLPVHLDTVEQDDILTQVNHRLSQCAFDFIALYRFPIPIEADKPPVQSSADKGWTEWAYLLKRLATKRRIPSHAIFQGQIKELTTVLDNSLEMRHATKPQPRPPKDDRTVLQFISAGIQVGRMLKDAATMEYLDKLYKQTEKVIQDRKLSSLFPK